MGDAAGVTSGDGVGLSIGLGVGVATSVIGVDVEAGAFVDAAIAGICDSLKKFADSILLIVSVSKFGLNVAETSDGTLGGALTVKALYIEKPTHITVVIIVKIRIVIKLGNLVFLILLCLHLLACVWRPSRYHIDYC